MVNPSTISNLPDRKPARKWGQTLALMVLGLPVLIAAVGLATDVGNFYYNYYKAQSAVDAAALAGATCMANPTMTSCSSGPATVASGYATTNGLTASELSPVAPPTTDPTHCPSTNCKISVSATRVVPYYFARVVGSVSGTLNVTGVAIGGAINQLNGSPNVVPIGLQYSTVTGFAPGTAVANLAANGTSGCIGTPPTCPSGNWGWVSLDGTGHSTVNTQIQNGYSGTLTQGTNGTVCPGATCVLPQPGVGSSFSDISTYRAASTATACSGQTWDKHPDNSPCAVTVILVDWAACGGGRCPSGVPILGFAELWIDSVTGTGSSSNITATWISDTAPGGDMNGGAPPGVQGGAIQIALIQ